MPRDTSDFLDPELTGGDEEYQPQINKPHIPNYVFLEEHPKYGKYFRHKAFQPWPSILYHKDGRTVIVKNAKEAAEFKVSYLKDESRLEFKGDWRSRPFEAPIHQSQITGKTLVAKSGGKDTGTADLIAALLANQNRAAPVVDIKQDPEYAEFLKFKAFKAGTEKGTDKVAQKNPDEIAADEKKAALLKVAEDHGIKIDKRWTLDRIEEELEKHDPAKKSA